VHAQLPAQDAVALRVRAAQAVPVQVERHAVRAVHRGDAALDVLGLVGLDLLHVVGVRNR
jgi:hypothetical protein